MENNSLDAGTLSYEFKAKRNSDWLASHITFSLILAYMVHLFFL